MSDLTIALLAGAFLAFSMSLVNWRIVFLGVIFVGFAQDPLRKLVPGEPVFFVVLCTAAMTVALFGAMMKHGVVSIEPMASGNASTRSSLRLLIAVVAVQAVLSWVRYGSPIIAAIGLLSYLSPVPAIWLAYHYTRGIFDVRRFLVLYIGAVVVVTGAIYMSKAGIQSVLFRQVGEGLVVYDPTVGVVETHPGLMRSAEVGAWHVGAAACILIVLAVTFRSRVLRLVTPPAVLLFLAAGVLTGRRKVLIIVATFAALYLILLYYYRHRSGRRALVLLAVMSAAFIGTALSVTPAGSSFRPYIDRGQTVFGGAGDRLIDLGLASVGWAIDAGGFFGLGAGAGSQGTQHFAAGGQVLAGGAAEGGLGKVAVELGVPGLILVVLTMVLVARNVARILNLVATRDARLLALCLGLVAFCAANIPVFLGASQIYGDPFVLMLLGSFLGFVLAVPRLEQVQAWSRDARAVDAPVLRAYATPTLR
jgi:hypothetical protein